MKQIIQIPLFWVFSLVSIIIALGVIQFRTQEDNSPAKNDAPQEFAENHTDLSPNQGNFDQILHAHFLMKELSAIKEAYERSEPNSAKEAYEKSEANSAFVEFIAINEPQEPQIVISESEIQVSPNDLEINSAIEFESSESNPFLEKPLNTQRSAPLLRRCECPCPLNVYLEYTQGDWFDLDDGYITLGAFGVMPRRQSCDLFPVYNAAIHYIPETEDTAMNLGFGFRYLDSCCCRVFGLNFFYDFRENCVDQYHRIGTGIEYLSDCFDFRFNGYFPVGENIGESEVYVFDDYIGDYLATCQIIQKALCGFDFEFGKGCCFCNCIEVYGALGGHFYSRCWDSSAYGVDGRIRASYCNFYGEIKGGYDKEYEGMFRATIGFSIPLYNSKNRSRASCRYNDCCRNLVCERIERQNLIVLDRPCCHWTWNWDSPSQNSQ